MLSPIENCVNEPSELVVNRLADLKIADNDEKKPNAPKMKMSKQKSSSSMLLKAFETRTGTLKCEVPAANPPCTGSRTIRGRVNESTAQAANALTPIEAVESYFQQHATKSGHGKTSGRTLSCLCSRGDHGLPDPVTYDHLIEKWKSKHSNITDHLLTEIYTSLFPNWPFYLHQGLNILLYGLGSKRQVLNAFQDRFLKDCNCIVIPAYDGTVNIRKVLNAITHDWLQMSDQCKNVTEQIDLITKMLSSNAASKAPLYLLLHNIDGPGLRNSRAQTVLAHLASLGNIHLIASVDHINMPILWSHNELARFSWIWEDCTTLAEYKEEANYTNSLFLQNLLGGLVGGIGLGTGLSGGKLASLRQVAASLTQNARDIFRMIAEHQLNAPLHETRGDHVGMPLEDLYWRCRDAFLTNSEATLRIQLTEFRDHKLINMKKGPDGTELLIIPMDKEALTKFLENFDSFC